jgi:hypothetical protein
VPNTVKLLRIKWPIHALATDSTTPKIGVNAYYVHAFHFVDTLGIWSFLFCFVSEEQSDILQRMTSLECAWRVKKVTKVKLAHWVWTLRAIWIDKNSRNPSRISDNWYNQGQQFTQGQVKNSFKVAWIGFQIAYCAKLRNSNMLFKHE